jgi:hypothetical protein
MTQAPEFLVRIDRENFFTNLGENGLPFGTPYPSFGAHMEYEAADDMCSSFRVLGFNLAVVTDIYGQPVSAMDLARFRDNTRLYIQKTLSDLNLSLSDVHGFQQVAPLTKQELEDVMSGKRALSEYESQRLVKLCQELRRFYNSFGGNVDWVQDKIMIANILRKRPSHGGTGCPVVPQ